MKSICGEQLRFTDGDKAAAGLALAAVLMGKATQPTPADPHSLTLKVASERLKLSGK